MIITLNFEFCEVRIFRNFIVVVMKEGITVKPEHNIELVKIAEEYFKDRLFGYITYRKYSYSVNPLVYLETSIIKNLVAIAVVCENGLKASNLELEKMFLKKPLRHFNNLDEAKNWINELVDSNNK